MNNWIHNRILQFLNDASSPETIVRVVQDDPSNGIGRAVSPSLAKKIIATRQSLPYRRFQSIEQVTAIKGLGKDTWNDFIYTFSNSAADAFERSLFDPETGLLGDNWTLLHYDWYEENQEAFLALVNDDKAFRHKVKELATRAAMETNGYAEEEAARLTEPLLHQYIDAYHNSSQQAALAFALWFYKFDADNWFSFERMLQKTDALFSHHAVPLWEMELRFFKGFSNGVFLNLISPLDLPVVVNYPEQVISIWLAGLAD